MHLAKSRSVDPQQFLLHVCAVLGIAVVAACHFWGSDESQIQPSFPIYSELENAVQGEESNAEAVLARKIALLSEGQSFLATRQYYTARIAKREVVGDELLDEHVIDLKYRQQPFSLYLDWLAGDEGREVLYVAGANDDCLLGHDGGWKVRLPAFWISPDSTLAMRDTRYPVTMAGLHGLVDLMLESHHDDLKFHRVASCSAVPDIEQNGRNCTVFTTFYRSPAVSATYRKSITWIDQEWNLPMKSVHFEWPRQPLPPDADLDESTMIESYSFSNINFDAALTDLDFDRHHPDYRFH
ncbi:MAG: DUF1571 domain-containing protein [Planctomycetaceae bacterium]